MVCIPSAGNLAAVLAAAAAAAAAALPLCHTITAGGGREASRARAFDSREDVAMEGNGAGGGSGSSAPPWDLGMHWAPASSSSYPQPPFAPPRPGGGASHQYYQLQELTCLKLGKRPCCWAGAAGSQQLAQAGAAGPLAPVHGNGSAAAGGSTAATTEGRRKEKAAPAAGSGAAAVARCQVEGCHVELAGAKEYHRRHKVCEAHSKAPRVVVLGAEQRFCQQCSRFHAISEFDDVKRSCRRRLAGHNERRRKSNASEAMARGAAHPHGVPPFGHGFLPPCGLAAPPAGALSLLSSARGGAPCLVPAPDISARSSAALDELIAENRAALLASWQFFSSDRSAAAAVRHLAAPPSSGRDVLPPADPAPGWHHHPHNGAGGGRYYHATAAASAGHTTLDLMQTAAATTAASAGAAFRPVPERAATATATATRPPKTRDGDAAGCSSPGAWAPAGGARAL